MAEHTSDPSGLLDEVLRLTDACLGDEISPAQLARLNELLENESAARKIFLQLIHESQSLRSWASSATGLPSVSTDDSVTPTLPPPRESADPSPSPLSLPQRRKPVVTWRESATEFARHSMMAVLVLGFLFAGILAYVFSTKPTDQAVVRQAEPEATVEPAAKIVNSTNAQWSGPLSPGTNLIKPGQRLMLPSGSAEIVFSKQARVIFEGPADFVITDAATCRLNGGKLTAHVPDPAKGFKVHTPDGTVTDLGTEFGVYVKTGSVLPETNEPQEQTEPTGPQAGTEPPVTEVHVFKGKVELAQVPAAKSQIQNPKSKILSAGQAVTISQQKIQPLPAADPFKFALDKLNGKPRTVLLSEDFESYEVGVKRENMGDWIVQGSTRKGQHVAIIDYDKLLADWTARHELPDPSLNPPPPSISRVLTLSPAGQNPRDTFPRVARPIEAPQLAHNCQVLVEFMIFPSVNIEPSFAFSEQAGSAPGIEFWRNADPTAPSIPWKPTVYRVRVLMDVAKGRLRDARVERSQWSGSAGWVRDADFRTPVPTVDWTTPPKFVIFGYPTVTPQTSPNTFHIDNIRIEVIAEK